MVYVDKEKAKQRLQEAIDYFHECYDYLESNNACEADYNIRLGTLAIREALPIISAMADKEEEEAEQKSLKEGYEEIK